MHTDSYMYAVRSSLEFEVESRKLMTFLSKNLGLVKTGYGGSVHLVMEYVSIILIIIGVPTNFHSSIFADYTKTEKLCSSGFQIHSTVRSPFMQIFSVLDNALDVREHVISSGDTIVRLCSIPLVISSLWSLGFPVGEAHKVNLIDLSSPSHFAFFDQSGARYDRCKRWKRWFRFLPIWFSKLLYVFK